LGFGGETLGKLVAEPPTPSPANSTRILRACLSMSSEQDSGIHDGGLLGVGRFLATSQAARWLAELSIAKRYGVGRQFEH
jgi:hypothetical protein